MVLHHGVIKNAEHRPEKMAFKCRGEMITYADLHTRSNGLADALRAHGSVPGDRIGICGSTSLWLPVALNGVHKAGCAFVPIDQSAPVSRIRKIIDQAGIDTVIVGPADQVLAAKLAKAAPNLSLILGCRIPDRESIHWSEIPSLDDMPDEIDVEPGDLAYIIFTSGSTGEPKGIAHTHASGLAYAERAARTYQVVPEDVIANFAPLFFDISTFGYFCSPLVGSSTVLVTEDALLFPTTLASLVERERVTIWYSAPLLLQRLVTHSDFQQRDLSALRWVKFGGEVMPVKYLAELMRALPRARFSNVYGPAEVNQCTYHHLTGVPDSGDVVPIGLPWDDTHALILDQDDAPTDTGAGQLAIASPTMMAGYWGNPELTIASLHHDGNRIYYKTGDLVERLDNGELVFLGRADRQVKVRGYRVELDDVEHHAMCMKEVIECAALLRADAESQAHIVLVAHCVPDTAASDVQRYLSTCLPRYACPHTVEITSKPLPRNASGKVDRRALLAVR